MTPLALAVVAVVGTHDPAQGTTRYGSCLALSLHVAGATSTEWPSATLRAANGCHEPVAVLTEPIETRVRNRQDRWVIWYNPPESSFAQLFVSPVDAVSVPEIDGGLAVHGHPVFIIVEPQATREIPIKGRPRRGAPLTPGQYEATLVTKVAPAGSVRRTGRAIRLDRDVASHNASSAAPIELESGLETVATARVLFRVH